MRCNTFAYSYSGDDAIEVLMVVVAELQKRANRANQLVLFFLAGANLWEKHAKTGASLVLIFWGGKLVGANFYAFCNYACPPGKEA